MKRIVRRLKGVSWKKSVLVTGVVLLAVMIAIQCAYPSDRTVIGAEVDTIPVGGMSAAAAKDRVQLAHLNAEVKIYFGDTKTAYKTPTAKSLGVSVNSQDAVQRVTYPWWLRLIPTSLWWAHAVTGDQRSDIAHNNSNLQAYITKELGQSCSVIPKNATITAKDNKLVLVPAEDGGTCKREDVVASILKVVPSAVKDNTVRVPMTVIKPTIDDNAVKQLITQLESRLSGSLAIKVGDESIAVDANKIRSWLVFTEIEGIIIPSIDTAKAADTLNELIAKKVTKAAGIVTITTRDFTELSRTGGGEGAALNVVGTSGNITKYLTGEAEVIPVAITIIQPQKKYIRSYSSTDTGLSALIQNYAETHSGVYGVSLVELSGQYRRAGYNETKNFFPASTYKLFVAYSVLRKIEAGQMSWGDQISGGKNVQKCFDDMIVLSDNPCAEALTLKVGYGSLNGDIAALGLSNTRFVGPGKHRSTAGDLSTFMASLETGQLSINGDSRNRLLSALKRNIYRKGVPAGTSGVVANKVGFIDALLHDAAIVYAPSGTYVLTIMTDGSSWASIAELTRQVEALRAQ